jgi:hypothetical protein
MEMTGKRGGPGRKVRAACFSTPGLRKPNRVSDGDRAWYTARGRPCPVAGRSLRPSWASLARCFLRFAILAARRKQRRLRGTGGPELLDVSCKPTAVRPRAVPIVPRASTKSPERKRGDPRLHIARLLWAAGRDPLAGARGLLEDARTRRPGSLPSLEAQPVLASGSIDADIEPLDRASSRSAPKA